MSKPVTDPELLKVLNGTLAQEPSPVSDPALLAQLNASLEQSGGDAEAQAGGFYGPAPVQGQMRRQIQRRAMAGLDPTPQQAAALEADKPAREQRTADFVNTMAPVAAMPLMPMGAAALPLGRALVQGVPLGAATGYVGGFLGGGTDAPTIGDHLAARHEAGTTGSMIGGALGAGIPIGVAGLSWLGNTVNNLLSPIMARMRPNAFADDAAGAMPASAGAAVNPNRPPPLPPITGPEAAAYQHIANRLSSAGVRPADLAQRLDRADVDSFAGNPRMGMVDLDPSLQRLAGSVVRQNQEAGNIGQRFMAGRQTGITPLEGMPDNAAIPTRPYMAAASPIDAPMGQFERMRETVRSALQVPPRSAYRVDQDLVEGARTEANRLYGDAYRMAQGVNVRSAIEPVLQRWAATAASADTPRPVAALITRALRNFQSGNGDPVQSLRSFQRSKEFLDDTIETLVNSANGKQRARAGMLGEIQRDLLAAVDSIPNVGAAYSTARGAFSSRMQMREALEAGRNALREGAEVSADAYRAYGPGEQQMFRVGLADAIERQMAGQKRGADVTQLFQNPRTQELLQEVMPQDAARRLGGVIQTENAMTRSNNVVFGNSATAQRMADDQAFNQMSEVIDTLRNRSVTGAALNYAARVLNKALGFRADEATHIARTLFTADRGTIDDALAQIARRMGANKADQFAQMMRAYQMRVVPAAAGAAGATQQPAPRRREYIVEQRRAPDLPPDPKPMPPSR